MFVQFPFDCWLVGGCAPCGMWAAWYPLCDLCCCCVGCSFVLVHVDVCFVLLLVLLLAFHALAIVSGGGSVFHNGWGVGGGLKAVVCHMFVDFLALCWLVGGWFPFGVCVCVAIVFSFMVLGVLCGCDGWIGGWCVDWLWLVEG